MGGEDRDFLEGVEVPAGYRAVPGGTVTLRTGLPDLIEAWFEPDVVRCGDRVVLRALLTSLGYDGVARFELLKPDGSVHRDLGTVPVAGQAIVEAAWTCQKDSDTWSDDPDFQGRVTLLGPDGAQLGQQTTSAGLRIVRAGDARRERCIPSGRRGAPMWRRRKVHGVWKWVKVDAHHYSWPCNFDVEFKDHVAWIIGKIKIVPVHGAHFTPAVRQRFLEEINLVWNNRFRAHRASCGREGSCDDTRQCCRFDIILKCRFVEHGEHTRVHLHPGIPTGSWGSDSWPNSSDWWSDIEPDYPRNVTIPHEFGHNIGLYDDYYDGGALNPAWNPNLAPEPQDIMNITPEPAVHHFAEWLGALGALHGDRYVALREPRPLLLPPPPDD